MAWDANKNPFFGCVKPCKENYWEKKLQTQMQFSFIVLLQCFLVSNSITCVDTTLVHHLAIRISDKQYSIKLLSESMLVNLIHWNVLL